MRAGSGSQSRNLEGPATFCTSVSRRAALPVQAAARNAMFWKTCKRDSIKQADEAQYAPVVADQSNAAASLHSLQTMRPGFRVVTSASSSSTTTTTVSVPASTSPASSAEDVDPVATGPGRMKLQMSVSYLPHPSKVSYGGEDAHFLSEVRGGAMGVADGVGGWQESGINPADYSRSLMRVACAYLEGRDVYEAIPKHSSTTNTAKTLRNALKEPQEAKKEPQQTEYKLKEGGIDPQGALHVAHMLTRLPGSSTALVMQLDDITWQLHAANLGDSGFMVVRDGVIVLRSRPLEHYFDCPHQFGAYPDYVDTTDTADGADKYTFALQQGDVIVAGTDGLWDNCFMNQILPQLPTHRHEVQGSARRIAALARRQAEDASFESPYILECQQQGYDLPIWEKVLGARFVDGRLQLKKLTGGKIDDITVIVAMAELQPEPASDIPRGELFEETLAVSAQGSARLNSAPGLDVGNSNQDLLMKIAATDANGPLSSPGLVANDWKVMPSAAAVVAGM